MAEPVYLGADDRPWFAWQHRAAVPNGAGLVIVPPFGYEAVCSHVPLRHLAERACRAGITAVRIDLDGTGDSAGDDLDADRVGRWCASIVAAIELVRGAGATRVVLAGVRLGATLAARVAAERDDIAGLVAIAPVVSGKRWLRELRALQLALGLAAPPPNRATDAGVHEAIGFALTAETHEAVTAIDLERAPTRPAPSVLVIDRDDFPANDRWVTHLREVGATVTHTRLPGYVEMMLDAHQAEVPSQIIDAALAFVADVPAIAVSAAVPARTSQTARLGSIVEQPIAIRAGDIELHAIASRPASTARPRLAMILLNAGCVRRIGPNRMYVAIARRLATEGTLVVRVDLSGIGDSPPRPGEPERIVFPTHAMAEITAAIDWCQRAGADQVILSGLCSGGYYAMEAAFAEAKLAGIVVMNPGQPNVDAELKPYEATYESSRLRKSAGNLASWKKLFTGQVDVVRIARVMTTRARAVIESRALELVRRLELPISNDLGSALVRVARRNVAASFVFCADEPGLVQFRERAGGALRRLVDRRELALRVIEGPDHTFTPRWSHAVLVDEVAAAVARVR